MSKLKAILTGLLATAYQMADGEIADLLEKSDDQIDDKEVLKALKDKDKERVSSLKKTSFDDGYKKAEKKVKSEVEKSLKTKFELDSDNEGDDLIDEIFEASKPKAAGKQKDMTDDDVKKHPAYVQMENQFKKQLDDQKKTFEDQISTKDKEYQKKEVFTGVSKKALEIFESMNPILSTDAAKAANQKSDFIGKLNGYDFETVEGKVIISKDGKVLEDEHGHKVDFDKFVKATAEKYYDFKVADNRTAPGSDKNKDQQQQKTPYTGTMPKTKEEYQKMINDSSIALKDRLAIRDNAPDDIKS